MLYTIIISSISFNDVYCETGVLPEASIYFLFLLHLFSSKGFVLFVQLMNVACTG